MTYRILLGAAALMAAAILSVNTATANNLNRCVSVSGRHVQNNCNEKISFAYCTSNTFTAPSGVVFRPSCNRGGGKQPYYSHAKTMSAGTSADLPIRDEQRFDFAVCPYRSHLQSSHSGDYSCVPW